MNDKLMLISATPKVYVSKHGGSRIKFLARFGQDFTSKIFDGRRNLSVDPDGST